MVSEGTETSQYLEENKSTEIPLVVVNERGRAQTRGAKWTEVLCRSGVVTLASPNLSKGGGVRNL